LVAVPLPIPLDAPVTSAVFDNLYLLVLVQVTTKCWTFKSWQQCPLSPHTDVLADKKCCAMHEWPQCESCTAALYGTAKVRLGPFLEARAPGLIRPAVWATPRRSASRPLALAGCAPAQGRWRRTGPE
jgi:hypothetical protein